MSNVAINIAAEFKGKPAFKQAETSVDRLEKRTRNLGRTLTASFGTAAIVAFGKASVKAFAEDDKAATALGTTLKNLNLAYGSNIGTVNGYINRLEAQTGVLDDELRPAMDRFLRATGDVAKAQDLLNLSLDVAAGTGKSVAQVSQSLQKAYLGQTQAIGRLGVGLTRAELTTSSFEEIQQRLTTLFAGQAQAAAETFAGELDKLTIAANNAKETIGKGLYDAITALSGGGTTAATDNIDKLATGIADTLANAGELISRLEKLKPVLIAFGIAAAAAFLPITTAIAGAIFLLGDLNKRLNEQSFRKGVIPGGMGNISMTVSGQVDNRNLRNQKSITKLTKEQAANQAKILKDKRLQNAIDKANLALNAGTDVFDMDQIQIAAALTNQAEQLGKATSGAQLLQIANDTARLNVKKSILALEDAIASKDEAAIIAATKKLNEDMKILNALSGQKNQMAAIESILAGLKPKDLIDQKNLDEALAKIRKMMEELAKIKFPTPSSSGGGSTGGGSTGGGSTGGSTTILGTAAIEALTAAQADAILATMPSSVKTNLTPAQISGNRYEAQALDAFNKAVEKVGLATQTAQNSFLNGIQAGLNIPAAMSGSRYAAQGIAAAGGQGYVINIQTGVGDPNAIAEAIDEVLRQARDRGTLTAV